MNERRVQGSRPGCIVSRGAFPATVAGEQMRNGSEGHRRGIGGNGGLPSERSERGSEGHRREPGAPERAKRARVCLPAHAYACARSAQARTGYSFVYRGFRWVCGVFFIVIAYRIY